MWFMTRLGLIVLASASLTGCATSTAPGAIGITRSQLLMLPSSTVNARAALGYSQMSSSAQAAGKLNKNEAVVTRVRAIGNNLIREVPTFRADAATWAWEINVFDSPEVNAFCAPGGKIGIYTGIIDRLELTDDELAAVMGHEIAHALREHSREKASQAVLSQAVVQGIASTGARSAGTTAAVASISAQLLLHLPFSRDMELEADAMGLELMARAGYDPKNAPNVWRKMQARLGGSGTEFFATHPNHERRIGQLEAMIPKVDPLYAAAPMKRVPDAASASSPPAAVASPAPTVAPGSSMPAGASALASSQELPSTGVSTASGKDGFAAERLARTESCNPNPKAAKGAGFEIYAVTCTGGEVWSIRCEFGQCRVVK